jgi:hypothetical protein
MPKKIALFGDSWGCGEWDTPSGSADSLQVVHPGLEQYLAPEFVIDNFCQGGSSNWDTLKRLQSYHEFNLAANRKADFVVVIQTSASRMQRCQDYHVDYSSLFSAHVEFEALCDAVQEIWYIKLDELAKRFDTRIYLVGGMSDVNRPIARLYPRLEILCESWQKLLWDQHQVSTAALQAEPTALELAKSVGNLRLVTDIIDHYDRTVHAYMKLMDQEGMGPADFHPSRQGHKILAQHIKKQSAVA